MTLTQLIVAAGICIFLTIIGLLHIAWRPPSQAANAGRNLRTLSRFNESHLVILSWQERDTSTRTLKCRLTDISEYSAGIRARRAWALGTLVSLRIPALRLAGAAHVTRCSTSRWKFDLGLEFRGPLYRI